MSEKVQQTETGNALQRFLKRKNIIFSAKRYGIDALGAMAQGLFCIAFDRYNYRNAGRADRKSGACGRRRFCKKRGRTGDGNFNRLCTAGTAAGIIFPACSRGGS